MDQPTAFFGGGYVIRGDIEFEGSLLQDPISIGAGSIANDDTMAIGVRSEATGTDAISVGKDSKAVNRLTAAFGYDAQATGMDATALGSETRAPSNWNTVVGYGAGTAQNGENVVLVGRLAEAQGNDAVAIGEVSRANGNQSTAVGRDTDALDDNASVFGQGSTADGLGTTVVGQGVTVEADEATSVGTEVNVSGVRATGVGRNSIASAPDAVAIGEGAEASAEKASALGKGAIATGQNSLAIGNDTQVTQDNTYSFGDRNVNLPLGRSFLYPEDAGSQTIVNLPVTDAPAAGTDQEYKFEIAGESIFEVAAEADGSGGIQNKVARIKGSFDIRGGGDSLADIVSGNISIVDPDGNEQVGLDATSDPVKIDLHNNRVNNFGIRSGESITYPTDTGSETFVDFTISDPSNNSEQSYAFSVGGNSVVRVFSEGDGAGGLKNIELRLDENLNTNDKDIVDNGTTIWNGTEKYIEQTALENDTVTYSSGDGLTGAGDVSLGGSSTINIGAGSFITANASEIEVNVGSGLEGDGTDNIRIRGDEIADGFLSEGTDPYQLSVNVDRGLEGDGSNNIRVDEDVAFDFTSQISFGSGLDVSDDIEDGATVIWNSTEEYIEQTALENDTVTLNTSNGISAGSVSLGGSVNIGIDGALSLDTDLEASGGSLIWDSTNTYIPQDRLQNDSVEYTAGNGIASAGSVSLGSTGEITVDPSSYVTVDANGVSVNIGTGLEGDGSDNIQIDQSTSFDFTSQIQFSAGLDTRGNITDGTVTIWNDTQQYINQDVLQNDSVGVSSGNGLTGGTNALSLGDSITIGIEEGGVQLNEIDESIAPTWTGDHTFNGGLAMGDSIDMQSDYNIVNLPSPTQAAHAARKGYVDSVAEGLNLKKSCQAATDGTSIDLSSSVDPNPIDGYTISDGDRVLLKDQANAVENGIYEATTAADPSTWVRASDFNEDGEVTSGSFTFVSNGTINGSTSFTVVTEDPIEVDVDPIEFDQFASAGEIIGGIGLTKDGQTLDVDIDALSGTGIEKDGDAFRIASEAAGDGLTGGSGSAFDIVVSDFAGSGIADDGSGDLELNTPYDNLTTLFGSTVSVGGKLNLGGDLEGSDGVTTIWDSTNNYVPTSSLQFTDITINGSDGLSAGTASLGGSTSISISGNLSLDSDLESVDGEVIWDEANSYIPQNRLQNDSVEYTSGNGISGAGSVSLGNSTSISVDPSSYITVDSNGVSVNIGTGLTGDGSGNITVDESTGFTFTSQIQFSSGIDARGNIEDNGTTIWDSANSYIPDNVLQYTDVTINGSDGLSGGTASLGGNISLSISGNLSLDSDLQAVDGKTIWDEANSYIPSSALQSDTITVAGTDVSLGSSVSISLSDLSGFDISGSNLSDGTTTIWNSSGGYVPTTSLENTSVSIGTGTGLTGGGSPSLGGTGIDISLTNTDVTINGNNGLTGGTVSLGGSTTVGISGALQLDTDLESDPNGSGVLIWDESSEYIPQGRLQNDSVTVSAGTNLSTGGSVSLGDSVTIDLADPIDLSDLNVDSIGDNGQGFIDFSISGIKRAELDGSGNLDIEGSLTEGAAL